MNSAEPTTLPARPGWLWAAVGGMALALAALCLWVTAGHAGRVWMGWLASGAVIWVGRWLARGPANRRPYAELLIAGGIAGFIGVVCAGQRQEPASFLRSGFFAWVLIAIGALALTWSAGNRRSSWLAGTGLALAWLAITLQQFTLLTLAANALLLAVALHFFRRRGWIVCVWLMLVAVHLGFLLGWPFDGGRLDPDRFLYLREYRWTLFAYAAAWAAFTWVALFSPAATFTPSRRLQFATLANALFFGIGVLIVPPGHPAWFWKFSIAAGFLMLIAWVLADRSPRLRFAYAAHGGLLITLGVFASITGREPAALLAVASVFFVLSVDRREQWALRDSAIAAALLAFACAMGPVYLDKAPPHLAFGDFHWRWDAMPWNRSLSLWLGIFTGLPLVFASIWISRHRGPWWRWTVLFYGALGLGMWLLTSLAQIPAQYHPPLLAAYAVIVTASILVLGIPEWPFLAASVLLLAHYLWFMQVGSFGSRPWWNPCVVVLCTLGLSHWWQSRGYVLLSTRTTRWLRSHPRAPANRRANVRLSAHALRWLQGTLALAAVAIVILSAESGFGMSATGLLVISLLAVGVTYYASAVRDWLLFGFAQFIVATAVGEFIGQLSHPPLPSWIAALAPIAALLIVAPALTSPFTSTLWERPARWVAMLYRMLAAAMFAVWVFHYISAPNRFITLALMTTLLLRLHLRERRGWLIFGSLICAAGAVAMFWLGWLGTGGLLLRDLLGFVLLLHFGLTVRREHLLPDELQDIGVILGLAAVTQWVWLWSQHHWHEPLLAVVWSAMAAIIVCLGWLFRERLYLAFGWGLLVVALGRVIWVDFIESRLPIGQNAAFQLGLLAVGLGALVAAWAYSRRQPAMPR